jgi:hypothetical protein
MDPDDDGGEENWNEEGLLGHRDGATYEPNLDLVPLNNQMLRVWRVMRDGYWRPLHVIAEATGDPEASVSARLRDFRKTRFGGHVVQRRRIGRLFEYRLRALIKERP